MHLNFCFEYQRLRKIREIIKSAHTLTGDAMRSHFGQLERDEKNVAARADLGMRMGVLGLGAAAATIFGALAQTSDTIPLLIGAGLASTALAGLHWLKSARNMQLPYLAVSGIWTAALAFMTSMHPVGASLALASSLILIGRAQIFSSPNANTVGETEIEAAETVKESPEEAILLLDPTGTLTSVAQFGALQPNLGDQLIDRIHVADRVQFLRGLSQLRGGEMPVLKLHLRLNTADNAHAARFEEFDLEMSMQGANVELRQSTNNEANLDAIENVEDQDADKRFLTIVSHELRTPLNAIIGFSDVLRSDLSSDLPEATRNEYIDLIHGAGSHLLSLVNTILDVSKIESGTYNIDRDEFDFPHTARECMAMLGAQAKQKNILINDRITSSSNNVNGDRRAVKQILINLLSNAIKYTEPNGFVTVDAQIDDAGLIFEVSDTGIGMSAADLDMIAKPFAQVDNSITRNNEGTGLGLALVKGLVELHGGQLKISSKLDVGTNVKVHIPNAYCQLRNGTLSELKPAEKQRDLASKDVIEQKTFTRKEIGHGTRKAG